MYDVWTHVIQSIIKLHTVMFRNFVLNITHSYVQKKFKANLNINIQLTIHVRSLPWHSGKVLESIGRKSSRCRQFETDEERK